MLAPVRKSKKTLCSVKDYIWNPATCSCENVKYLARIACDKIIDAKAKSYNEESKTNKTYFNGKNAICKTKRSYNLLVFLLITIELFIAVSIYCCLIKYK